MEFKASALANFAKAEALNSNVLSIDFSISITFGYNLC
jgi:hypothetical protein